MSRQRELEVALDAVRAAAVLCQAVQADIPAALTKADRSPVTVADFGSQALVCRALRAAFPDDPIIGEEDSAALAAQPELLAEVMKRIEADADEVCRWIDFGAATEYAERFWTLDPIDGTKGFLRGDQYAVALALVEQGEVVLAALACPNLDAGLLFHAVRGEGTWMQALDSGEPERVSVSDTNDASAARFCESFESGHSKHDWAARVAAELGITVEPRRLDSQAKYGVVARGGADLYLRLPTRPGYQEKIWDHAAGWLVVTEAGGRVTDIEGKPLDFGRGQTLSENRGVVASNGHLHDAALAAIAAGRD